MLVMNVYMKMSMKLLAILADVHCLPGIAFLEFQNQSNQFCMEAYLRIPLRMKKAQQLSLYNIASNKGNPRVHYIPLLN